MRVSVRPDTAMSSAQATPTTAMILVLIENRLRKLSTLFSLFAAEPQRSPRSTSGGPHRRATSLHERDAGMSGTSSTIGGPSTTQAGDHPREALPPIQPNHRAVRPWARQRRGGAHAGGDAPLGGRPVHRMRPQPRPPAPTVPPLREQRT